MNISHYLSIPGNFFVTLQPPQRTQKDQLLKRENQCSKEIIGAAIEVHRYLRPGLLVSSYEECLCRELAIHGLSFERQKPLGLLCKDVKLDCGYRLDIGV